jgi:uncharacterized protein
MFAQLIDRVIGDNDIWRSDVHGLEHWERVESNGHLLADVTGADKTIITYFAYLHDSRRWNEDSDPDHGHRAALYARGLRDLIALDDNQFNLLLQACSKHTDAMPESNCPIDKTLAACWDADRLDIGRVGIDVDSKYLFSNFAKELAA